MFLRYLKNKNVEFFPLLFIILKEMLIIIIIFFVFSISRTKNIDDIWNENDVDINGWISTQTDV